MDAARRLQALVPSWTTTLPGSHIVAWAKLTGLARSETVGGLARLILTDEGEDYVAALPDDFEERWTGAYIFENEWQSFRTRQSRELEMTTVSHTYPKPGRYVIAVKVIDIFGNDTMTLVPVTVG